MKKIILSLATVALVLSSCGSDSNDAKNEFEEEKNKAEEFAEGTADDPIAFNDGLVAEIDMSEVQLAKLWDLDDQDAPAEEIVQAAEEIIQDLTKRIDEVSAVTPIGTGGEDFLAAAVEQLYSVKNVAQVFIDFSEDLSIPDDQWTEEQGDRWMNLAEPAFADYDETFSELENQQSLYASYHDMDIIPSDVTIDDMYEQSKEQ